ncbi:MAG: hypothetical protein QOG18_1984 [Microbacteriaceae bacterium]|nr:hypothetical protein [Microbacteriaceae bacterium]
MPMRIASFLLALVIGVGVPGFGDLAAASATAPSKATSTPSAATPTKTAPSLTAGVTFTVAPDGAGVLAPGQDLHLTAILSNGTTTAITAGTATVYLNRSILTSRTALNSWIDASDKSGPALPKTQIFQAPTPDVPPGESRTVSLVVPAASIGIGTSSSTWGARAFAVDVTNGTDEVAQARSTFVWNPGISFQPTKLALTMPITVPASTSGLITADALATYTAPDGILTRQLNQVIDRPVAIGIDPMIIASIGILGDTAPPSAVAWLEQLKLATNDTFALSYADSDLAVSSQAGQATLPVPKTFVIDPTLFATPPPTPATGATPAPTGAATTTPTPTPSPGTPPSLPTSQSLLNWNYTIKGIAWPRDDSVVSRDLATFAQNGLTTTLLNSTNVSYGDIGYTPSASANIDGHPALVADGDLSALAQKAILAPTTLAWQEAMAELSASAAVVTRERPGEARTLLASLGRDYPQNSPRLRDTLTALGSIPWLASATMADAIAVPAIGATVSDKPEDASRIKQVSSLFASENAVGAFSSVLKDPTLLTGPRRLDLLSTLSNSWVGNPTGWDGAMSQYLKTSSTITNSVTIVKSSAIFQPADQINLPVTVRNDLDYPVSVLVTVRSPNGILKVVDNGPVALTIEPNSQSGARVTVQSVANGDVNVRVTVSSPTGVPVGGPSFVEVNVQAGWETAITVVIAVLLLGVFGFGIWRNISKRRKAAKLRASGGAAPGGGPADAQVDAPESTRADSELSPDAPATASASRPGDSGHE